MNCDVGSENLAEQFRKLIHYWANSLAKRLVQWTDTEELVADGYVGLMLAKRDFDPDCGVKFSTYARHRIQGEMLDGLRRREWIPRHARERGIRGTRKSISDRMQSPEHETDLEFRDWLDNACKGLSKRERLVMRLIHHEGMRYFEAAPAIGVHPTLVRQINLRIIQQFREEAACGELQMVG